MATIKVELTKDMLALIANIRFKQFPTLEEIEGSLKEKVSCEIDFGSLYGGNFLFEDISYIIGIYDRHIPGTEEEPMGPRFSKEDEDYMWELHSYIVEHIADIEDLVHQFSIKGGLTPGVYVAKAYDRIWEKE